jgi:hypothetical protein
MVACLGAAAASGHVGAQTGDAEHRVIEATADLDGRPSILTTVRHAKGAGAADGPTGCAEVSFQYSSLNPFDSGGEVGLQLGMVEQEIAAISITLDPSEFPVIFRSAETIFARTGPVAVETTTEWSLLVWEGTPDDFPLETFSSDGTLIPHAVIPPDASPVGVIVGVVIDPGDPDQVVIDNDGSNTFSVGFRIDTHHQPATSSCNAGFTPAECCPPPQFQNAFLNTDTIQPIGATFPAQNWLRCRSNCGILACPGGWHTLQSLGSQGPGGDWNIRTTYKPFQCPDAQGACCITAGMSCSDETEADCTSMGGDWEGENASPDDCSAVGGTFQGDGVTCAVANCPPPLGACCVEGGCVFPQSVADCAQINGIYQGDGTDCITITCIGACCFQPSGCVNLGEDQCTTAEGFWQGDGTDCGVIVCFPNGACCFEDGTCGDGVDESVCLAASGTFQGDGVLCSAVNCPQPLGACCLSNGSCLDLVETDCNQIPNSAWVGALTDCTDADQNGTADACEVPDCPEDLNTNGAVDFADILIIIANWGCTTCPTEDLNGNGTVDFADILLVIANWGPC